MRDALIFDTIFPLSYQFGGVCRHKWWECEPSLAIQWKHLIWVCRVSLQKNPLAKETSSKNLSTGENKRFVIGCVSMNCQQLPRFKAPHTNPKVLQVTLSKTWTEQGEEAPEESLQWWRNLEWQQEQQRDRSRFASPLLRSQGSRQRRACLGQRGRLGPPSPSRSLSRCLIQAQGWRWTFTKLSKNKPLIFDHLWTSLSDIWKTSTTARVPNIQPPPACPVNKTSWPPWQSRHEMISIVGGPATRTVSPRAPTQRTLTSQMSTESRSAQAFDQTFNSTSKKQYLPPTCIFLVVVWTVTKKVWATARRNSSSSPFSARKSRLPMWRTGSREYTVTWFNTFLLSKSNIQIYKIMTSPPQHRQQQATLHRKQGPQQQRAGTQTDGWERQAPSFWKETFVVFSECLVGSRPSMKGSLWGRITVHLLEGWEWDKHRNGWDGSHLIFLGFSFYPDICAKHLGGGNTFLGNVYNPTFFIPSWYSCQTFGGGCVSKYRNTVVVFARFKSEWGLVRSRFWDVYTTHNLSFYPDIHGKHLGRGGIQNT